MKREFGVTPVSPHVSSRTRTRNRTKIVWSVLGVGVSLSVAMLTLLDSGGAVQQTGGMALSPLMGVRSTLGIDAIFQTTTPIDEKQWDSIVIVHSGAQSGSAADIASEHLELGYDGLGFHFVIGNGSRKMSDGEIHVGARWMDQRNGAQLAGIGDGFNSAGTIEICLVGDGDRRPFTDEQIHRLAQVVVELADRFNIGADQIDLHSDLSGTTSPGKYFPRAQFEQMLASMG